MSSLKNARIAIFALVLAIVLFIAYRVGFLQPVHEENIPGTYVARTEWGSSTLVLEPNHTFHQTVQSRGDHASGIDGVWRAGSSRNGISGNISLLPCLSVTHIDQGRRVDACYNSINITGFRGMEISADPDFGIAFRKESAQ